MIGRILFLKQLNYSIISIWGVYLYTYKNQEKIMADKQ